ncbi:hypothetical protein BDZ97DRAFT_2057013 [Flammula alnicola]|nr:hypothetical protein BDZ97DRAFT_2057013 [Flammula alnicola]
MASESKISSQLHHLADGEDSAHSPLDKSLPTKRKRGGHVNMPPYKVYGFPELVTVKIGDGEIPMEAYTRALLFQGHGIPVWVPPGNTAARKVFLQRGVNIGDVGVLDRYGMFYFAFNIFLPPDDPIHAGHTPREFVPFQPPPNSSELRFIPGYHKPGTVITSPGIKVARHSETLLDVSFSSEEKEGGILVLPKGASREDLLVTDRLHGYVKHNAPHWYQAINGYSSIRYTNGSLMIVTGCDKTRDWANASFPYPGTSPPKMKLRYSRNTRWIDEGTATTDFFGIHTYSRVSLDESQEIQCIFVRGLRISLSGRSWWDTMPRHQMPVNRCFTLVRPSTPQRWFDSLRIRLRLRLSERDARRAANPKMQQPFQPNFIISQVLLDRYPDAEVALVDDSIWCSLVEGGRCTVEDVNNLVTKVFELYKIIEQDGIVTLAPKSNEDVAKEQCSVTATNELSQRLFSFLPASLRPNRIPKYIRWVKDITIADFAVKLRRKQ